MTKIAEAVRRELLPKLEASGLSVLRWHGKGESEVVDLVFRNVRINLFGEKGYCEVQFGPLFEATWVPATLVTSHLGYDKRVGGSSADVTVSRLVGFLEAEGDRLQVLFTPEKFKDLKKELSRPWKGHS